MRELGNGDVSLEIQFQDCKGNIELVCDPLNNCGSSLLFLCQSTPCHIYPPPWFPNTTASQFSQSETSGNQEHSSDHIQKVQVPGKRVPCFLSPFNSPGPLANGQLVLHCHSQGSLSWSQTDPKQSCQIPPLFILPSFPASY